jgi:hypothetical protein
MGGILIGASIEDHVIRCEAEESFPIEASSPVRGGLWGEIELALDEGELACLGPRSDRIDNEGTIHAVGNVHRGWSSPAVIHESTRNPSNKSVVQGVTREHVHVVLAGRDLGGVEVHAVGNGGSVHQSEVYRITLPNADNRPGHGATKSPGRIPHPGGDGHRDVLHFQSDLVEPNRLCRWKLGSGRRRLGFGASNPRLAMRDICRWHSIRLLLGAGCRLLPNRSRRICLGGSAGTTWRAGTAG